LKRIIVCIKPVPDPKDWGKIKMDPATKTLIREGVSNIINPLDKHALEAALQVKESSGGEVVVVSMAPPFATSVLREALAMGADRAILLTDRTFAGSDTLSTARVLAEGIRRSGPFDLVFCGDYTLDGWTAQIPSQLAELLGIPNVMHVCRLALEEGMLRIDQRIEQGMVSLVAEPPVLLSFNKEVNKPRFISFVGILEAEKKDIMVWSNSDLGLGEAAVGLAGSPTKMADLLMRQKKREGTRIEGKPEEIARRLAERFYQLGIL
jgi:electron transfer flavoprotein beta subunit